MIIKNKMSQQIDFSDPKLQEILETELSKFLLGDIQKETIFDKLGKFIKYSKKRSDKYITSYYMKMREYFYNYQYRKAIQNEKDIKIITDYFHKFDHKNYYQCPPKIITIFGGSAQLKDRFTLSLNNLFDIKDEDSLSDPNKYFVNVPPINENLFRVAELTTKDKKNKFTILFIPEINYFPKGNPKSKEEFKTKLLINNLNQFLLLFSEVIIILKTEGLMKDNEQKMNELLSMYNMNFNDSNTTALKDKILFINCLSNFYIEQKGTINMTYQESTFPNFSLSLDESLELQSTNLLCVKNYVLEKIEEDQEKVRPLKDLYMIRYSCLQEQLNNCERFIEFDYCTSNCVYDVYYLNKNEFSILVDTPGELPDKEINYHIEYESSDSYNILYVYLQLYSGRYKVYEKIPFDLPHGTKTKDVEKILSHDVKFEEGLTIVTFRKK